MIGSLHTTGIILLIALPGLGVTFGQALAGKAALAAINRQPKAKDQLLRIFFLSLALNETAAVICVLLSFMMLASTPLSFAQELAQSGIIASIALPSFVIGCLSALPAISALQAAERQPFFIPRIMTLMLLLQAMMQTPLIFSLVVSVLLRFQVPFIISVNEAIRLFASGLVIGIGAIGPVIGLAILGYQLCKGLGINREAYPQLRTFAYVSAGLIETPILFTLIISLIILLGTPLMGISFSKALAYLAAAISCGASTAVCGIASGVISGTAIKHIAQKPALYNSLYRASMLMQTLIDTVPIYGLLVALVLIFGT